MTKTIVSGIEITNPDKVVFGSGIRKIDVANYYEAVGERMFRYAGKRLLSVIRCPGGIDGGCFFNKHPKSQLLGVKSITVEDGDGSDEYFYVDRPVGFVAQAQMGTIEFHTWGSSVKTNEQPDMMVFDLDPDEAVAQRQIVKGVTDLKEILDQLGLRSFLKTSGGKGYHVVVPFVPSANWEEFYSFSKSIAEVMESKWGDLYTTNIRKVNRKGKIFIDWVRNGRGATSVAPYSLRARASAGVSMPLNWDELDSVAPDSIKMDQAVKRCKEKDPWEDFFNVKQQIGKR